MKKLESKKEEMAKRMRKGKKSEAKTAKLTLRSHGKNEGERMMGNDDTEDNRA